MSRTAVVTGAGSGVGQAVALQLVKEGWNVGLIGRRAAALQETIRLAGDSGPQMRAVVCDVSDAQSVTSACRVIEQKFGTPRVLVAAAGGNIPRRGWDVLSVEDYRGLIDANLNGVFNCVHALLPGMRTAGSGTIVAIVSDAGLQASAKAGAAYVASKFGLRGLCQSINCEERAHGIRCTAVLPGDINTPILDKRPVPPSQEARSKMLQPEDVTACVMLAINLPERAIVEELLVRPR
ncbi:MAG TPA: SDR family oxidoreductase [Tepidisphaeraceae bacterium]|jgi:NADP-dependent 3-hydroxy acid dehydrogenase YdfG